MKRKKILIFGATGMAGHVIYFHLKNTGNYDVCNAVFRQNLTEDSVVVDVKNTQSVDRVICDLRPDIIINCVGVLIKGSQEHPDNAVLINAYFPHLLKRLADQSGARLIHLSTDCVFSGKKGNYNESDFRDADDIYGRSKALGEVINDKDLTIRTSIIGPELKKNGEGLFHWFMQQKGTITGYKNAVWAGVTTVELARAIEHAIESEVTGLVHVSNGIPIDKYSLLLLFQEIWNKNDITIEPFENAKVDKSIARSQSLSHVVPDYRAMLEEQLRWMEKYRHIYQNIYLY